MPTFLDECHRLFGTRNLYELLSIDKDASANAVKRAYRKLSLVVHPDRVEKENRTEATAKFQTLGKAYSILSDKDKRAVYDETGEVDDDDSCLTQDRDWYAYWRLLFDKISVEDIKNFESQYKGSEEELNDLKSAYEDYQGDFDKILENVLCSNYEDEARFREILNKLIENGELPKYEAFISEPESKKRARKRKAAKEAAEAEALKAELGLGSGENSLKALIAKRQQSRAEAADDFFSHLEDKYAKPKKAQAKKGQKGKK